MPTRPGAVCADPTALDAYVAALTPPDQAVNDALAGLPGAVAAWNARPTDHGGRIDPDAIAAIDGAVDELTYLDLWVGRVARAFRAVDRLCPAPGCGPVVSAAEVVLAPVGPPSLRAAVARGEWSRRVDVLRDGRDGRTRVVRLDVDTLPEDVSPLEWQVVVEEMGIAGGGPLHVVVHGWTASTGHAARAGEVTADLYDQQGVEGATVLVVDWAEGEGVGVAPGSWGNFRAAEASARATGDALGPLFTGIAAAGPTAEVNVTAHSLGAHVVARALSGMDDPSSRFSVDCTLIQPAVPASAPTTDTAHYGALVGPRVRDLTVTVNTGDDALFWYERQGPQALGDEAVDGAGLAALVAWRRGAGLGTRVVDHASRAGHGHLGLTPDGGQGLVRSLVQEQVDRLDGPSAQTEVRRWLYDTYAGGSGIVADIVIDHPAVEAYFDGQQQAGRPPTVQDVERLIRTEVFPPSPLTPSSEPPPTTTAPAG